MAPTIRVAEEELKFGRDHVCLHNGCPFTGVAVEEFENGGVRSEISYLNGVQSGLSRDWYPSGQLRSESEFLDNSLHGESQEWFESGALKEKATYETGIELYRSQWAEDGTLLEQRSLPKSDFRYGLLSKWRESDSGH